MSNIKYGDIKLWFSVYVVNNEILCSNYDNNLIDCVNGLIYVISSGSDKKSITLKELNNMNNTDNINIFDNINPKLFASDFILKNGTHYFRKVIEFNEGIIIIYQFKRIVKTKKL